MQVRLIIATNQNLNKHIFVAASRKGHLAFGIWHLAYSGVAARRQHFYQMTPGQRKLIEMLYANVFTDGSFFYRSRTREQTESKYPFPHILLQRPY